jgi:RNA polymerase sigma factor for flagellar operon FliA
MKPTRTAAPASCTPSREELATYMPLVHQTVARVLRRLPPNVLRDDLVAAGTFGLIDAFRKSSERGPAFDWYARIRIRGAVVDELRAQDWLSRRARNEITKARARGEGASMSMVGLDDLPEQAQGLVDTAALSPHQQVESRMTRAALDRAVGSLPEREASIVTWHYVEGLAFKDIADRLGVSQPRVSQLHSRAIDRLRTLMVSESDAAA